MARILSRLTERILHLNPAAKCLVREDDYDTLVWNSTNSIADPPTFEECEAVTIAEIDGNKRQNLINAVKAKLNEDPLFATIAAEVVRLKAASDGTTVVEARNALLADLESRIS